MNKKYLGLLLAGVLVFSACGNENNKKNKDQGSQVSVSDTETGTKKEEERKLVYTSFYPIYDLTKQIAGDKMDVENLGSLETEAHDWEASAKDLAKLNDADLLIVNGAGMEGWLDSVAQSSKVEILDTTEGLYLLEPDHDDHDHEDLDHDHEDEDMDEDHDHEDMDEDDQDHEDMDEDHDYGEDHDHDHHHGQYDPHTWLSPVNGKEQAQVIAHKLGEIDPANEEYYQENYEKLAKELDDLIKEYKEKFASKDDDEFVVPHEAFGYLTRDFDLEQIPLTGITSTEEPDAKTMSEVTEMVKKEDINTIFYEKGGSDKAAQAIAKEIGGEAKPLSTLEFVSKEDLEKEVHYQDLIRENLEAIYKSLEK